ncbi:GNAT family N-acetyltransferase [Altererythrobacter aerius]|uniref:GNAT family N-acetyltransferase n=1 Tax=Tsuneonella aeria TaxID=1837929 RepID=A0A6I4TFY3_9SPHN|nr:N-acetyltransferase [Tsuneonella aeria]MXO75584.1 GNAT family N-acetyltransferase [Tsuneonella aeria]
MTVIRPERPGDGAAIRAVTAEAFLGVPHSDGSEPDLIDRLRAEGDLTLSLVCEQGCEIVGHVAFSRVTIADGSTEWYGLGPVSVLPAHQGCRIGARLIEQGLAELTKRGARGVVLLGDPEYYSRFGFAHDSALMYPGPPPQYFQRLVIAGAAPAGIVRYAPAFG